MSARLFKHADIGAQPFVAFTIPGLDDMDAFERQMSKTSIHAADDAIEVESAANHASAILADARAAAARIIDDAHARALDIEKAARERGLASAHEAIADDVAAAVAPLRDQLAATLDDAAALHDLVAERAEHDLLRLALEIARKIVHRETTMDPEIAVTLTRVALSRLQSRAVARVHLNPEDHAYVMARADRLSSGATLELVQDATIGRGGCLIRTDMGDVDARIERQFTEIERGLLGAS